MGWENCLVPIELVRKKENSWHDMRNRESF